MIVAQEPAEPGATADVGVRWSERLRRNQPIVESLVIPVAVVVSHELAERPAQVGLAEEHEAVQTFFLNRSDEVFRMRVAVWRAVRRLDDADPGVRQRLAERPARWGSQAGPPARLPRWGPRAAVAYSLKPAV